MLLAGVQIIKIQASNKHNYCPLIANFLKFQNAFQNRLFAATHAAGNTFPEAVEAPGLVSSPFQMLLDLFCHVGNDENPMMT